MTQQLTVVDKVKEVIDKSGVAFELNLTEVSSLAKRGKAIKSVDDENFLPLKREMQKTRKYVVEYFESARSEFNRMSKGIIEVQKIVLDEFTGEENRLIALDKAEKERVIKVERLEALPAKRERITTSGVEFTDEEILGMADADFELEYNIRLGAKLEADRVADQERREAEQVALNAEKLELQRQKDEAERVEKVRVEERNRAEEELRIVKETAEREKQEAEARRVAEEKERVERAEREKQEAEAEKARVEAERIKAEAIKEAMVEYQAFLKKNKYNEKTDIIHATGDGMTQIYRFVAEFKN